MTQVRKVRRISQDCGCLVDASASISKKSDSNQCWNKGLVNLLMNNDMTNCPTGIVSWWIWLHKFEMNRLCQIQFVTPQIDDVLSPKLRKLIKAEDLALLSGLLP